MSVPAPRTLVLVLAALLASPSLAGAQTDPTPSASAPSPAPPSAPRSHEIAADSPAGAVRSFLQAAQQGRWDQAGAALQLPPDLEPRRDELALRLKAIADNRRLFDIEALSGDPAGTLDDGLTPQLERVATVSLWGRDFPVRMVRVDEGTGAQWLFTQGTMSLVDEWYRELPDRWLRDRLTGTRLAVLLSPAPFGLQWWHLIALPLLLVASWMLGRVLRVLVSPLARRLTARTQTQWDERLIVSLGPPLTLLLSLAIATVGLALMQFTTDALRWVGPLVRIGFVFALFWALWRSVAVFASWLISRTRARANPSALSLVTVGANISRGAVVMLGVVATIAALGYPVGTVLAGLGIGGLALAFGAQKTVENIFGSVALAVDQPIRVGDFVKAGDIVGTVEDIGLRSTRLRTLDRTVVSVPNGVLADQQLESFQLRDRMRLATTIGLTYDTTADQVQAVITGLERVLADHPRIWSDAIVVKFQGFGASSLDIEVMAWFAVPTWGDFQVCRQEVLLDFMRVVEREGSSFAFPTRTVHLVGAPVGPPANPSDIVPLARADA